MVKKLVTVAALVCLTSLSAVAQPTIDITTLVLEGDSVPGVGNVTRIDNVAVNTPGDWYVEADTDFSNTDQDQVLLKNDALILREDDTLPLPEGARLDFFDSINLNSDGDSGWNLFLDGTQGTFDDSGIYFNTTLVIQESDTSTAEGFSPNTPYVGFFDAKMNGGNQVMIVASVDDPAISTTVDRAIVRLDLDSVGSLLSETVIAKEGDVLPGQTESITEFGTDPHESAFNEAGDILYIVELTGSTAEDEAIYLTDALIAQKGGPSPIDGRNYAFLSGRGNDLNNNGEYVFKARLDGDAASDVVLVKNDEVFKQEGETFPAIAPFQLESFGSNSGPVQIDDGSNVVWYGDWNDPNTNIDTGLFWNEHLIIQEGVTIIDGSILDEIANVSDAFMLSDGGGWLIFEGTLLGGINGAFLVSIDESSGVEDGNLVLASSALSSHPNPFSQRTSLSFRLSAADEVSLDVFDVSGRLVKRLAQGAHPEGLHEALWNGEDHGGEPVGAGIYFLSLQVGDRLETSRVVRIR
jgi:hypothetical protein